MASDPRLNLFDFAGTLLNRNPNVFGVAHAVGCPSVLQRAQTATQAASLALQSTVGVVGSFANLAAGMGGGAVGLGLSTLAGISDAVRIGGMSQLPQAAIGNGQSYVLKAVGIDQNKLNTAGQFNPSVANNAFNAASQVYNSVSQGKFTAQDIPAAFSAFQNGTALISSLFNSATPATEPQASQFGQTCGVGNYATDLIRFAPKYKFLFVVEFEFDPAFQKIIGKQGGTIDPAFVIKTTTRPNVDFEYEDINMYNFRTKVAKKTVYQPITMKFLDDDRNNALQFYNLYLKLISPIANINADANIKMDPLAMYDLAGGGMGFESTTAPINGSWSDPTAGHLYAGSLGTFGNADTKNILRRITIIHVYRQGTLMNVMNFFNPKIIKLELDELDMSSSEGAEVSFTFSYDSMYIEPGVQVFNPTIQSMHNPHDLTNDGLFPLGVDTHTSIPNWNQKDGFGLASAQTTISTDNSILTSLITSNQQPVSAAPSVTLSGSNLAGIASVAPTIGGSGTGTVANKDGNNMLSPVVVTATKSSVSPNSTIQPVPHDTLAAAVDSVTGNTPSSQVGGSTPSSYMQAQVAVQSANQALTQAQGEVTVAQQGLAFAQYQYQQNPTPANQAAIQSATDAVNNAQSAVGTAQNSVDTATAARNALGN